MHKQHVMSDKLVNDREGYKTKETSARDREKEAKGDLGWSGAESQQRFGG